MRERVSRIVNANPGDEIVVTGILPSKAPVGRLYVFSASGDFEFSPHVQNVTALVVKEQPQMLKPMSLRLIPELPKRTLTFTAEEKCRFCVMQELDMADDVRVKVRLSRRGPWALWFRNLLSSYKLGSLVRG